jgi:hypothetical protein
LPGLFAKEVFDQLTKAAERDRCPADRSETVAHEPEAPWQSQPVKYSRSPLVRKNARRYQFGQLLTRKSR